MASENREKRLNLTGISDILLIMATAVAFAMGLYVSLCSLVISVYQPKEPGYRYARYEFFIPTLLVTVAFFFGIRFAARKFKTLEEALKRKISRIVFHASFVFLAAVLIAFIVTAPYYPEGDQLIVATAAALFRKGDYTMLTDGGYLSLFPYQKGITALYGMFFTIFGNYNFFPIKCFNALCVLAAFVAGRGLVKEISDEIFAETVYCILFVFCAPLIVMTPYAYGDVPSIAFALLIFLCLVKAERTGRVIYAVLSVPAAVMALLTRNTSLIVFIAVIIGAVLLLLRNRKKLGFAAVVTAACILVIPLATTKTIDVIYEKECGHENFDAVPKNLFIAMGMHDTYGVPGVFNRYHQEVFEQSGYNAEIAAQTGNEYIKARLTELATNPGEGFKFVNKKIIFQWDEPMFESFRITAPTKEDAPKNKFYNSVYHGRIHDAVWLLSDFYQSVVYISFTLYIALWLVEAIRARKRKEALKVTVATMIPVITFVGGFLFSILWESQCKYVLPYYVFMLIYAAAGLAKPGKRHSGEEDKFP